MLIYFSFCLFFLEVSLTGTMYNAKHHGVT
uniref:Uncharacterized protein n=1 Tax=Anguilla anguilla TaxID=7936 RepID=A0A0E9P8W1_ANGAN